MDPQVYKWEFHPVTQPTYTSPSDCNGLVFCNVGLATIYINEMPLAGGAQLPLPGNYGEVDKTIYRIRSNSPGNLWVLRKKYQI